MTPATTAALAAALAARTGGSAAESFGQWVADVPAGRWAEALTFARDEAGCGFFDWLAGVDEGDTFGVVAHVWSVAARRHLIVRTSVPRDAPSLETATGVYRGASWHEREAHEMFGIDFTGHPGLAPLLLPDGFEGHPLRKDFVLAARVAKTWPGAKEPGESGHAGPGRRRMTPPGVPDAWGPGATPEDGGVEG